LVKRFFQSILDTVSCIETIEIVLCLDDDDIASQGITHDQLHIKKVVLPRGATMGLLNRACFDASSGQYVIGINDDVIIRTKGWDKIISDVYSTYPDDIALIHVNDLLFRDSLCTFPILSRKACLEIGICPEEYRKYRIDDHIYDTYNILAYLGYRRIVYLSDVIFEHDTDVRNRKDLSGKIFKSGQSEIHIREKEIITSDISVFKGKLEERKQDALKLVSLIDKSRYEIFHSGYGKLLNNIKDPYSYRQKGFVKKISSKQYGSLNNLKDDRNMENDSMSGWAGDVTLSGLPCPTHKKLLIQLMALIKSNRLTQRIAETLLKILEKALNQYLKLPVCIRKVMDRPVFKLIRKYREIKYSGE